MTDPVYIRPLEIKDALVSYSWRNNPRIWRLTGSRPTQYITPEIESEWLEKVLNRPDERRFAICLCSDDRYIGNIYLTNIKQGRGMVHVFIGDMEYWGGGRAHSATLQLVKYAFEELHLDAVYCEINQRNLASVSLSKSTGFRQVREYYNEMYDANFIEAVITKEMFIEERTFNLI